VLPGTQTQRLPQAPPSGPPWHSPVFDGTAPTRLATATIGMVGAMGIGVNHVAHVAHTNFDVLAF
jgi:hypothetical protein